MAEKERDRLVFVTSDVRNGTAGIFEFDGSAGYFYLYRQGDDGADGGSIEGAIRICGAPPPFAEEELEIRFNPVGDGVGLVVRGELWAVFYRGKMYGRVYRDGAHSAVPEWLIRNFEMH